MTKLASHFSFFSNCSDVVEKKIFLGQRTKNRSMLKHTSILLQSPLHLNFYQHVGLSHFHFYPQLKQLSLMCPNGRHVYIITVSLGAGLKLPTALSSVVLSITSLGMLYCGFLGRIRSLISPLCDITSFLPHSSEYACIPPKKITILHSNWRGRRCFRSSCLNLARCIAAIMAILATSSNYCNIWCLLTLRIWHKECDQHSFKQ